MLEWVIRLLALGLTLGLLFFFGLIAFGVLAVLGLGLGIRHWFLTRQASAPELRQEETPEEIIVERRVIDAEYEEIRKP